MWEIIFAGAAVGTAFSVVSDYLFPPQEPYAYEVIHRDGHTYHVPVRLEDLDTAEPKAVVQAAAVRPVQGYR